MCTACNQLLLYFQVLHRSIDRIERRGNGTNGGSLIICCKDLRVFKVDISGQDEYLNVADSLEKLSAIGKTKNIDAILLKNLFRNGKKTQVYLIHFFFVEM